MARTIVRDPRAFLLDEPLSNLDARLRVSMRTELKRLHAELEKTFIYVTHDQAEALIMSDRIAVLNAGGLQQLGTPEQIYNRPANAFVAGFVGSPPMNFFAGKLQLRDDGGWQIQGAGFTCAVAPARARGLMADPPRRVRLGVRPEDIEVASVEAATGHATVVVREPMGSDLFLTLEMHGTNFKARTHPEVRFDRGEHIPFRFAPDRVHLFSGETEESLFEPDTSTGSANC